MINIIKIILSTWYYLIPLIILVISGFVLIVKRIGINKEKKLIKQYNDEDIDDNNISDEEHKLLIEMLSRKYPDKTLQELNNIILEDEYSVRIIAKTKEREDLIDNNTTLLTLNNECNKLNIENISLKNGIKSIEEENKNLLDRIEAWENKVIEQRNIIVQHEQSYKRLEINFNYSFDKAELINKSLDEANQKIQKFEETQKEHLKIIEELQTKKIGEVINVIPEKEIGEETTVLEIALERVKEELRILNIEFKEVSLNYYNLKKELENTPKVTSDLWDKIAKIDNLREEKSINVYVWYSDSINCTIEKLDGKIIKIIYNCSSYEDGLNKGIEYVKIFY